MKILSHRGLWHKMEEKNTITALTNSFANKFGIEKYTMDYEFNLALVSAKNKKYSFYGVAIPAVFNMSDGTNVSSASSEVQRIETIALQFKYTQNFSEKLRIFIRRPKFILKNWRKIKESQIKIS